MRKRTLLSGAVAITAAGAITIAGTMVAQAQETGSEALGAAIDAILANPKLTDSQSSIIVKDAATGEVLYDHNGNQRALPGSNQKLSTVAGALETLGEDFTFTTDLIGDRPEDGVVSGDLYLRGSGDPTMLAEDYDKLAADLAALGVSQVDGDLVADDTAFDQARHGDEWAWGDLQYSNAMEISALTIGSGAEHWAGTVRMFITPGAAAGDPGIVEMKPANDYVTVVNEVTTGTETDLSVNRDEHANTVRVTGTVAVGDTPDYYTRSVINPTALVADVFKNALEDNGIELTGDIRLSESTPQGGETLAVHESIPLSQLAGELLKPSNNSYAEALFKAVGYHETGLGTFESGKAGIYAAIEKYGVDTDPIRQVDGSGMSRFDEVTPDMITDLLIGAKNDATWGETYYNALPVACTDGTLASRMCNTPAAGNVHAKSGSLTSVSALSGYATDADGRELVFSIVFNDYLTSSVKSIEDQIAVAIASHSEDATEADISTFSQAEEVAEPEVEIPGERECTYYEPVVC